MRHTLAKSDRRQLIAHRKGAAIERILLVIKVSVIIAGGAALLQRFGDLDGLDGGVAKGGGAQIPQRLGQRDLRQSPTSVKGKSSNLGHTVGDNKLRQ